MKKMLILAACICAVFATGCNNTTNVIDSDDIKNTNEKIDKLEKKLDEISKTLDNITDDEYYYDDDYDFDEEIHELYDDTAVLDAYKSGDSSKLTDKKDIYILEQATAVLDEIITDGMSDYDKELVIYNYMFENARYDDGALAAIDSSGEYAHTPYGFFHDHSTICVGNATTFKLFMDMLEIDSMIIHSTEEGEHAWNTIKLDDEWYHVDTYFDGGENSPMYSYFNVPDSVKENDTYSWDTDEFPACEGTTYCYALKNAIDCASIYDIPKHLKTAYDEADGSVYLKLPVPENTDANDYIYQLIYYVFDYLQSDTYYIVTTSAMVTDDGKSVVIGVIITDHNEWEDDYFDVDIPDIDTDKLSESFGKVFDGEIVFDDEYYYTDY